MCNATYDDMTSAMFKDFINSGGEYTEFTFDGRTNTVCRVETGEDNTQKSTVIYQGEGGIADPAAVDTNSANEPVPYIIYIIAGLIILVLLFNKILKKKRQNIE